MVLNHLTQSLLHSVKYQLKSLKLMHITFVCSNDILLYYFRSICWCHMTFCQLKRFLKVSWFLFILGWNDLQQVMLFFLKYVLWNLSKQNIPGSVQNKCRQVFKFIQVTEFLNNIMIKTKLLHIFDLIQSSSCCRGPGGLMH